MVSKSFVTEKEEGFLLVFARNGEETTEGDAKLILLEPRLVGGPSLLAGRQQRVD